MSQRSNDSTPRWVKVLGIIIIALILLVAVALVTGIGGPHGPGRHVPPGDTGSRFDNTVILTYAKSAMYTALVHEPVDRPEQ